MKWLGSGLLVATVVCVLTSVPGHAEEAVLITPDHMKWEPVDVIPGVQLSVVYGDAAKPGPFVIEVQWPQGSKIGPHWHSNTERVTIMFGTGMVGMGDTLDLQKGALMPAGSYAEMPGKMHHWFVAKTSLLMLIEGEGPFDIHLVHPEDDPANKAASKQ